MPKLSAYVSHAGETPQDPAQGAAPQPETQRGDAAAEGAQGKQQEGLLQQQHAADQQQHQQQQQQPDSSKQQLVGGRDAAHAQLAVQQDAAVAKLETDHAKRLREHGPRAFRWPDGNLRPECPPPNRHTVSSRRQWAELVRHCRTHGGDRAFERHGVSLRYGIGVPHEQHAEYLARVGLQPETGADGAYAGDKPDLPAPLDDPQHAFNTYFKEGAAAVFKDRRGRLL